MRSKQILVELIDLLEQFESRNPSSETMTLADFVGFLNGQMGPGHRMGMRTQEVGGDEAPLVTELGEESSSTIARLVGIMNRYARTYIKRALEGTPLQTGEEFSFLIVLMTYPSLTKTELIQKNIMEKTSGMEVIKRLEKLGMIDEFDDPDDGRSRRISISEQGKQMMFGILPRMHQVSALVTGNLTTHEQLTLAYLLKKLDEYHLPIFLNEKNASFEALEIKYLRQADK